MWDYNKEILKDKDKDKIIGSVLIGNKKDKGFICDLKVNKKYRGKGYGKILLDRAVKKYGGIDLTVEKENLIAFKMYKDYGFKIYKEFDDFYWMKI
jgi:ribosomal protein S18 acetylase RimI-like enzyme